MDNEKLYRIATNTWCFFNICEVSRHFHCIDRCWNPYAEYLWIIYGPIIGSLLVRLAIYLYHVTGACEQTPIPIQKHFHNICISQAFTLLLKIITRQIAGNYVLYTTFFYPVCHLAKTSLPISVYVEISRLILICFWH